VVATGNKYKSDLYLLNNIVQNTQLTYPKELIIGLLRDEFSKDSYYHYVKDPWGFPLTPDHTDLPSDAGIEDDTTTRVYIGEVYRNDVVFYPALIVRNTGSTYNPISFNRNRETVKYGTTFFVDGYGNKTVMTTPTHYVFAGAWDGSFAIDVYARGIRARDDLAELTSLIMAHLRHDEMLRSGLLIKGVSLSSSTETEDRGNEKLHKQTVNLQVRSEWRVEIPVESVVDAINICVDFGNLKEEPPVFAPNISINTIVNLQESIVEVEA